jgi:peptidoglycan biosynthesis protein MviN/MurJ (putative lipid II flippase)
VFIFVAPYFEEPVFALAWGLIVGAGYVQLGFQLIPFNKNGFISKV